MDFNDLEKLGKQLMDKGEYRDALRLYFYMAEGDASLDAGWWGWKIGQCYEALNQLDAARYWYSRAVHENPTIPEYVADKDRLGPIDISDMLGGASPPAR